MPRRLEADYWRQRARCSRTAAVRAADVTARSAHARLALAYDDRAAAMEQPAAGGIVRLNGVT